MDDFRFKPKMKKDPNCEEYVCQQESLYNKYKAFISKDENLDSDESKSKNSECPLGKDSLGYYTWGYLHTMAAYYPLHPTEEEKTLMKNFITSFAHFYPCKVCSKDFQNDLRKSKLNCNIFFI